MTALSLIAHSWVGMATARFAGEHAALVDRLVLFAPIARREAQRYSSRPDGPAWRIVSIEDQWARFVEDVPADEPPCSRAFTSRIGRGATSATTRGAEPAIRRGCKRPPARSSRFCALGAANSRTSRPCPRAHRNRARRLGQADHRRGRALVVRCVQSLMRGGTS
jgi:pimeloyl-ACP methyl ester carboxylesterase